MLQLDGVVFNLQVKFVEADILKLDLEELITSLLEDHRSLRPIYCAACILLMTCSAAITAGYEFIPLWRNTAAIYMHPCQLSPRTLLLSYLQPVMPGTCHVALNP